MQARMNSPVDQPVFSYQPMPFYDDYDGGRFSKKGQVKYKLDLNLYCIKRPSETCFIRVSNPNMLPWGIEEGDMLVVEKQESLSVGDLVVLEEQDSFQLYELFARQNDEFVFMNLDSKGKSIFTADWRQLPLIGTVTSTIHQMKPKRNAA